MYTISILERVMRQFQIIKIIKDASIMVHIGKGTSTTILKDIIKRQKI